jgi:transposase
LRRVIAYRHQPLGRHLEFHRSLLHRGGLARGLYGAQPYGLAGELLVPDERLRRFGQNLSAQVIVSEIGIDMSRFPSAAHLISWACICPRNDESAGKRRSNRQRKGGNWLKTTVVQCALAAARKKGSYLQAQFYRIKARRGPKKAIMAVVASILTAIYHMLKDGTMYQDLGCDHFKRHSFSGDALTRRSARLASLGRAARPMSTMPCGWPNCWRTV